MASRSRRHQKILDLIDRQSIRSQQSLRALLARDGIDVTQATLSRDLRQLGLAKGPGGYMLPPPAGVRAGGQRADLSAPRRNGTDAADDARGRTGVDGIGTLLVDAVRSSVDSVRQAGSLVVLRTGPGRAQPVAVELDRTPPDGVVGTIAGDDTVFIAAASAREAKRLVQMIAAVGTGAPS